MKNRSMLFITMLVVLVVVLVGLAAPNAMAQGPAPRAPRALAGTAFTYQGQLKNSGTAVTGTCDMQFGLWDALTLGALVGAPQTAGGVVVTNGLFTTQLDFGNNVFNGDARWLESAVRCPAGGGTYTALSPRQVLNAAPIAFALPGLYTQQNATSPNVIGGYNGNTVSPSVVGATIGGGGANASVNTVNGNYATVPGGALNLAQGDYSFAAGRRARALNQGTFVWGDSTNADFTSTGNNQFLVRANGGVGINTNNPTANLEVAGGDLKVSNAGSGIIFPDASKQTTAASKVLDYNETTAYTAVGTTPMSFATITVDTGASALFQYSVSYNIMSCSQAASLYVDLRVDGVLRDLTATSVNAPISGCNTTTSTMSQFRLITLAPGTHVFEIRAYSTVTNGNVAVTGSRIVVINR